MTILTTVPNGSIVRYTDIANQEGTEWEVTGFNVGGIDGYRLIRPDGIDVRVKYSDLRQHGWEIKDASEKWSRVNA